METTNNGAVEFDIKELFYVLLHKLWVIIIAVILGSAIVGLINQFLVTPIYTSTTKVYVINRQDESKMTYSDLQTGSQLTQDYMILVRSRPVMEKVIEQLNLSMSTGELADMIYVVNPEGTRILEISVINEDPALAKEIADAIAVVSSEQMVNIMEMEKVNIVEYGNLPTTASSPDIPKNTVFGGLMGAVLACLIIIIIHMMNDNIRTSDDIEKYLGITTLGIIPVEEEIRKKKLHKVKQEKRKEKLAS